MSEELKQQRRELDEIESRRLANEGGPQIEPVSTAANPEYERFEALARKLTHAPDPEHKE